MTWLPKSRHFSWVRSLLLYACCWQVLQELKVQGTPQITPEPPENFDPAEADPQYGITCLGAQYAKKLPIIGGFDPNSVSMQKLCAKPQYGGGLRGQHLGGYCIWPPESGRGPYPGHTGVVAFDSSKAAEINSGLANPRILLGCQYRCFCNRNVADLAVQPKLGDGPYRENQLLLAQSESTYELKVDVFDDLTIPRWEHMGKFGREQVEKRTILRVPQGPRSGVMDSRENDRISLDPANKITCNGPLPPWPLPGPFSTRDFKSLQEFCPIQLSGGLL